MPTTDGSYQAKKEQDAPGHQGGRGGLTRVQIGQTMPEQNLRVPLKHALVDQQTDLKSECEEAGVSYDAAAKAQSGNHEVANRRVQDLFQRLLHAWKPGSFGPARGQEDQFLSEGG